ncbi:MAG: glutamate 5-kinase [Candidatus Hadarchaeia archaeon]
MSTSADEDFRKKLSSSKRIVVKIGTNSLTDDKSQLDEKRIGKLVSEITDLMDEGRDVILVTSGAIGAGMGKLSKEEYPENMESLQAASTIGQSALMRKYSEYFEERGYNAAQLLLTKEDFMNSTRFKNLKNTLETLFEWNVVPIINENDAIAVDEIRMGDNDLLSAFTASGSDADLLILLTDVDGLFTKNPKNDSSAKPIRTVEKVTEEIENLTRRTTKEEFGGMQTKVQGAKIATEDGIPTVIAQAEKKNVLSRIISGEKIGTLFKSQIKE